MKTHESYYPVIVPENYDFTVSESGISMRDKLAHDYLCAMMSNPIMYNNHKTFGDAYDAMLNIAFELAYKFIKMSENEK